MPYRCREKECKQKFSVKTGTVMECAKVGYQDWLIAAFLLMFEPQERVEHEAPPRSWRDAENRVVPRAAAPGRDWLSHAECLRGRWKWMKPTSEGSAGT